VNVEERDQGWSEVLALSKVVGQGAALGVGAMFARLLGSSLLEDEKRQAEGVGLLHEAIELADKSNTDIGRAAGARAALHLGFVLSDRSVDEGAALFGKAIELGGHRAGSDGARDAATAAIGLSLMLEEAGREDEARDALYALCDIVPTLARGDEKGAEELRLEFRAQTGIDLEEFCLNRSHTIDAES
jgi:hypothetical protein